MKIIIAYINNDYVYDYLPYSSFRLSCYENSGLKLLKNITEFQLLNRIAHIF